MNEYQSLRRDVLFWRLASFYNLLLLLGYAVVIGKSLFPAETLSTLAVGLAIGTVGLCLAVWQFLRMKKELRRYFESQRTTPVKETHND